ncbi:MAG: flippase-like domain-containing protein [Candidatus Riflebacteria bacterium]|nr:flippase-like domain-containing protein [Candidatus Riflebacteria bacterium]
MNLESENIIRKLVFWVFAAIIMFSIAIALFTDFDKIQKAVALFSPFSIFIILFSVLINYLLRFIKWEFFLRRIDIIIPLKQSLWIFFSSFAMVLSPGKLGEIMKSLLLKSQFSIPISKSAPIVMAERITDLLGLSLIAAYGSSKFAFGGKMLFAAISIIFFFVICITRPGFWQWIDKNILARFARLAKVRNSVKALEESSGNLLSPFSLLVTVPLSAVSWAGEGVALYFIFLALKVDVPDLLAVSLFAHSFSSIAGAFSFLPGGLLVTEGILGVFFVKIVGIAEANAVTATLMIRTATLWFAVFLGTTVFIAGKGRLGASSQKKAETQL